MAAGVNVRFAGELSRSDELEEACEWAWLRNELSAGAEAAESEFVALDAEDLLAKAKESRFSHA
jgi:hypothetical protein